jgi:hypothetical protein
MSIGPRESIFRVWNGGLSREPCDVLLLAAVNFDRAHGPQKAHVQ